ncbi:hypothetical protein ACFFLM_08105 [Deinococcus oregonensis]|uniref:Uncharacterized protein n=1 Tax=Deinococcus oregonensis TaxID=1805970 RepID=A0ABV6AYY5_9DEIO
MLQNEMSKSQYLPVPLNTSRFERIGGTFTLIGIVLSFLGLSWDIEWHADVGPDTFWTLPHLFVYAGSAIAGIACLTVCLITTKRSKTKPNAAWVSLLGGRFHAPVGFVLAGFGSLGFLSFGLFDQWWHLIYGFDVLFSSPPHVGLFLSLLLTMWGSTLIFARGSQVDSPRLCLSIAVTLGFGLPIISFLAIELGGFYLAYLFPAMMMTFGMALVLSITRRFWSVIGMSLCIFAFRIFNGYGIPYFNQAYADYLGYSLRETADIQAGIPILTPAWMPVAALVMSIVFFSWVARGKKPQLGIALATGLATPFLYVHSLLFQVIDATVVAMALPMLAILGAGFGWIGWQVGVIFRSIGVSAVGEQNIHTKSNDHV